MQKLELLAPAKNYLCAIAAIKCGADAIYCGAENFGARSNAGNSIEEIEKIINFAHLFNVKVYITINTILKDKEIPRVVDLIKKLYEIKADAIIFQDFSILSLMIDKKIPPILLHASTQCDISSLEKVKFFENTGIKRVVLARELSLEDIKKIAKNTNIELEYFVHGALCVSYSGNCYMSCFIGDRSANRGECAQVCRKKYSLVNKNGNYIVKNKYLLSLKDNNLSNHLRKLIDAGVTSFKIEGRLKDENYVKNTVLFYHKKLKNYPRVSHGKIIEDFIPNPDKTFNRGFCDDYLFNKKDNIYNFTTPKSIGQYIGSVLSGSEKFFTISTKENINACDGLCFMQDGEFSGCYVNSFEKTKTGYKIYPNKKINLKKDTKIYRNFNIAFDKILQNSKTIRKLNVYFTLQEGKIILKDDFSNKIEIDFEYLESALDENMMKENFIKSLAKTAQTPFLVEKIEFKCKKMPFLPVSKINELRKEAFCALEKTILKKYKTKKQKNISLTKFPISTGDYRLNIHNEKAKEYYSAIDCEVLEMSFESNKNHSKKELMRCRHCLKRAFLGCGSGDDELFLEDEKKVRYPLKFDCKNCRMIVLAP